MDSTTSDSACIQVSTRHGVLGVLDYLWRLNLQPKLSWRSILLRSKRVFFALTGLQLLNVSLNAISQVVRFEEKMLLEAGPYTHCRQSRVGHHGSLSEL